jgi:Zn-dependent protease with chaperone function
MDGIQIFGLVVSIAGLAIILVNAVGVIVDLSFIPTNVFIIGFGFIVIGLVLVWNQTRESLTRST